MSAVMSMSTLVQCVEDLTAVLEQETALLDILDMAGAMELLPRKEEVAAALKEAADRIGDGHDGIRAENEVLLAEMQAALQEQAEANQAALVRSLEIQDRLMQTIAKAVPVGRAEEAPSYQPDGRKIPARPPEAYVFQRRM